MKKGIIILLYLALHPLLFSQEDTAGHAALLRSESSVHYYAGYNLPPLFFPKNRKEYSGIIEEVIQLISGKSGISFIPGNPFEGLNSETPLSDLIYPMASIHDPNLRNYFFTDAWYTVPNVIIAGNPEHIYFDDPSELKGKKIILVRNLPQRFLMEQNYPQLDFILMDSVESAFKSLQLAKGDFLIIDLITAGYFISKNKFNELVIVGSANSDTELRFAVPPSLSHLIPELNDIIHELQNDAIPGIIHNWTAVIKDDSPDYRLLGRILAVFIIIIIIILIWNQKLQHEIRVRIRSEESLKISELKAREAEELSVNARKRAEKLAIMAQAASKAKSQFLANMSHEIRTPLNSIIGFTELLETSDLNESQSEYLQSVKISAEVLLNLINDILDLSKIEAGKMSLHTSPVSIPVILRDMKTIFSHKAEASHIDFHIQNSIPDDSLYMIDSLRLEQVLINLVGNALKFTESGFVRITAEVNRNSDNLLNTLVFKVEDSGIGIEPDQVDRIFNLFEQSENQDTRKFGGTGLGLGISSRLANLMGGFLSVKSELGKGTEFRLTLPDIEGRGSESSPESQEPLSGIVIHSRPIQDYSPIDQDEWIRVRDSGDPELIQIFCRKSLDLLQNDTESHLPISVLIKNLLTAAEEFNPVRIIEISSEIDQLIRIYRIHDEELK